MRRAKDISSNYFEADKSARFNYLYDHFYNWERLLECLEASFFYLIESMMIRYYWDEYCQKYNEKNRDATLAYIKKCMENGETFDFAEDGIFLPDDIMLYYKNYFLMKLEYQIFNNSLASMGGDDEKLLRRYISGEITLWDIADDKKISYETAKGRIRDLKKELKEQTIVFFADEVKTS
ncbi:MAG: hypothetical protein J5546_01845 [Lachnospiraceae bacterium]|nr:hypothetical protein [Lachnospiraceae bacterium]